MQKEESFRYVRYADDMIIAIEERAVDSDSERVYRRFRQFFLQSNAISIHFLIRSSYLKSEKSETKKATNLTS